SIPWDHLSLTFQHAIEISHRLGVDYIWIDSLCIIQDDISDWARGAATMCDVYTNSYLTIAATNSDSGEGGCYSVTGTRSGHDHSFSTTPDRLYTVHARKPLPHFNDFHKLEDETA
ncbi:HET-domain-containing protein, partial [Didymella exigua CBS 183.55]